jgi:phosphate transport system ATP-binding protein
MAPTDPLTAYRWPIPDRPPPRRQRVKIQFENVNFWYGTNHVLHDVSMAIPEQSVAALIGPSGCGKTTLLRLLNRMSDLVDNARHTGAILLDGQRIDSPSLNAVDLRRRVGMVFQKSNAFPRTIYENVVFGPRLAGIRERDRLDYLVERCLKQSALWSEVKDRLGDSALELSGGQQQRLCIARSLATDPEVLLMDEPASALDPKSTQAIEDLIASLKRDYTIVIVTHNMQQAARVADATAFFYEGRLIEYGSTEQIFRNPKEKATEDYISGRFG